MRTNLVFALLAVANAVLLTYIHVRHDRRFRRERVVRSLRRALDRNEGAEEPQPDAFFLERAS